MVFHHKLYNHTKTFIYFLQWSSFWKQQKQWVVFCCRPGLRAGSVSVNTGASLKEQSTIKDKEQQSNQCTLFWVRDLHVAGGSQGRTEEGENESWKDEVTAWPAGGVMKTCSHFRRKSSMRGLTHSAPNQSFSMFYSFTELGLLFCSSLSERLWSPH